MAWPLSQDYNEAIQSVAANFADPDLRRGVATVNALGLPMPFSGNFADVYRVDCPDGGRWAVKCFTREVPRLRERYQEISRYLRQVNLPFTMDFNYLEEGIRVSGRWYPVLKMQWVEGLTFNQFVSRFLDKPRMLEALLRLWARMRNYLRSAGAAHGDLQHGNVLLVPGANANALALKLIDYDGMFVPALAGSKSGEVGHPSYQHPQRLREGTYGPDVDRFPLLLIGASLAALKVKGRSLWEKYDNADNLLFREADLREPAKSELFRDLSRLDDPATAALTAAVRKALAGNLGATLLLEEVLEGVRHVPVSAPAATYAIMPEPKGASSIATSVKQAPSDDGIWDFSESIAETSASEPARPRTKRKTASERRTAAPAAVWIGGAAAAIALLIGAVTVAVVVMLLTGRKPAKKPDIVGLETNAVTLLAKDEPKTAAEEKVGAERKAEEIIVTEPKAAEREDPAFDANEKVGEVRQFALAARVERGPGHIAAITSDGSRLVRGFDKHIQIIRVSDGRKLFETDQGNSYPLAISIDPTGRYVALGEFPGGAIDIWTIDGLTKKKTFRCKDQNGQEVSSDRLAFSPDGKRLLTCASDCTIRLWDWEKGEEVSRVTQDPFTAHPSALAFSPDGLHFLIGNRAIRGKPSARVMRVEDSMETGRFVGHSADVSCVAVAPDNRHAVSGGEDKTVRIWDLRTAAETGVFDKHKSGVNAVAVSPDGRWVLSSAQDDDLRLWELDTGREVYRYSGKWQRVATLGFLADGRHAYSTGFDNVVRIWRLPSGDAGSSPPPDSKAPETKPIAKPIAKKPVRREAVPDAAALEAADAEIKETYKAELAKREREDLLKLSGQLARDGANVKDKPAAIRYVLLREARDLAAKAGSFQSAMSLAESMAHFFTVDAWEMKAEAMEQADPKSFNLAITREARDLAVKTYHRNAAIHALAVADSANEHDAFAAAERLAKIAQANAAAARDVSLTNLIFGRIKEFAALRKAYEAVPEAKISLGSRADDPVANVVLGRFYALVKGDWDQGLPLLARGDDAKLRELAKCDLACGLDANAMTDMGDQYAAHAQTEEGEARTHTLWRACNWYERAEGLSKGPLRNKVAAKRNMIEKALAPSRPVVLFARYGASTRWVDATESLRRFLLSGTPKLAFPNGVCQALELPDPASGEHKTLIIVYRHRGRVRVSTTGDADPIHFPEQIGFVDAQPGTLAQGQDLAILCARYGADGTYADATLKIQQLVKGATLAVKPAELDLGDPVFGKRKWLIIVYRHQGKVYLSTMGQDEAAVINLARP